MTGVLQVVAGGASGGVIAFSARVDDSKSGAGVNASGSIQFQADGTIVMTGSGSTSSGAWYRPTGTPPVRYAKLISATTAPSLGPAVGVVQQITGAAAKWTWSATYPAIVSSATVIGIYADAGATQLLASSSVAVQVATGQ